MKKNITLILLVIFPLFSCSKILVKDNSSIKNLKKPGLIIRISQGSKISKEETIDITKYWLNNYEGSENIQILNDADDSVSYFKYPQERFYQLSNENEFLKYKSIGVANHYLQSNRNELVRLMAKHNLDSLIIFEVYSIISTEMQFMDFDTVLLLADTSLNIVYLDHNTEHFDSESSQLDELKNQTIDKIDESLISKLQSIGILGSWNENTKRKIVISEDNTEKIKENTAEKTEDKNAESESVLNNNKTNDTINGQESIEGTAPASDSDNPIDEENQEEEQPGSDQ